ncbi:MAG: DnaD domain protein [Tenericutes bacterium]|nr:DnaD domain protein [Mycoplasmatota bacterium]
MKTKNILDIMKTNNIVIPSYLLKTYKKLNISEKELIFLSYLITFNDKILFDINKFSISTSLSIPEIMELIDSLTSKSIITMVTDKKETGMIREYLDISSLYDKIIVMILNESETESKETSTIYDVIEKEFGRCLSPIEYETIKGWLDSNISEDLIKEALKEAILNGVNNLKYIDRILYEWNKKGYKKPSDVVKKRQVKEEKIDLFDYDWLDEE